MPQPEVPGHFKKKASFSSESHASGRKLTGNNVMNDEKGSNIGGKQQSDVFGTSEKEKISDHYQDKHNNESSGNEKDPEKHSSCDNPQVEIAGHPKMKSAPSTEREPTAGKTGGDTGTIQPEFHILQRKNLHNQQKVKQMIQKQVMTVSHHCLTSPLLMKMKWLSVTKKNGKIMSTIMRWEEKKREFT